MIISRTEKGSVSTFLLAGSLLLLTGCFQDKKELRVADQVCLATDKGELLLSIDGKPVLYAQDFEEQKAMAMQSEPRLQMILQMVPDAEYTMIFKSLEAAYVIKEYIHRQGIDETPEFKKTLRDAQEAFLIQMCMKAYQDAHPITVTKKEAQDYYNAHKSTIQGLATAPAGIEVIAVKFDKKEDAENFAQKAKDGSKKHFEAAAKELGLTVLPMVISDESYADEVVKSVALSATKFPSKEVVKTTDGSYMVLGMISKKDAEYHSFDLPEVEKGITDMCMNEKREAAQLADIAKFKEEFNVVEHKAYFEKKSEATAQMHKALQQAHNAAMNADQSADDVEMIEEDVLFQDKI
ncbi:peptidyl-prolyl cis-trans isomerase [Candidatus Chromulinivorax destructor]|uniref:PpiC domain-containing protein n=1 Tax=Candidatus Chromulinivorax destructor TaxID=2066483 RepID=A0A345ZC57_9BACT|nr:peptidylprolyl isomerase [Candidatus Chromulinivorax destructor]AXK60874.1 hypothetical protein C0J27_03965 [Candidatus Chromulinivorax destructor]